MQKSKLYKLLLAITNIVSIAGVIFNFVNQTKYSVGMFWGSTLFIILFMILYLDETEKGKLNYDMSKTKSIKQRFGEANFSLLMMYAFIFLTAQFIRIINDKISYSLYLICGYYVITIVFQLMAFSNLYGTNKEINRILDEKSKTKK